MPAGVPTIGRPAKTKPAATAHTNIIHCYLQPLPPSYGRRQGLYLFLYPIVRKSSKTSAAIIFIESVFGYSQRFHEPSQRTASRRILSDGSGRLKSLSYRCAMRIIRSIRRTTNPWSCFGTPRQKFRLRESGFGLHLHLFQKQKRRGSLQSANYSVLLGEQYKFFSLCCLFSVV